jgi:hypothetical protein
LGNLLLRIGRKLGKRPSMKHAELPVGHVPKPERTSLSNSINRQSSDLGHEGRLLPWENPVFPVAHRENNGWIRMSLTSFCLPRHCCFCTAPARDTFLFHVPNKADSGSYPLNLFTCNRCCDKFRRRKRILNFLLFGLPLASFLLLLLFLERNQAFPALIIGLSLVTFVVSWIVNQRFQRLPAKVRYSSASGIFQIRFRNPDYENMVLAQRIAWQ